MQTKLIWLPFLKQYKWQLIGIVLLGLMGSLSTLLIPLSIGKYMEVVFDAGSGKNRALELLGIHLSNQLFVFFGFFALLLITKFIFSWAEKYFSALYGEKLVAQLRMKLFSTQLSQPNADDARRLLAYSNDVKALQNLLTKGILGFIRDTLFLVMALYLLFRLQPILTITAFLLIIGFYWLHRYSNKKLKPYFAEKRKRHASLLNYVARALASSPSSLKEPEHIEMEYQKKSEKLLASGRKYQLIKTCLAVLTPFLLYLMMGILLAIMAFGMDRSQLNSGDVVTYILLLLMMFPAIRGVIRVENTWMQATVSGNKFLKIVKGNTAVSSDHNDKTTTNLANCIALK